MVEFGTEIRKLIAEIKSCIKSQRGKSQQDAGDREFDLQWQAFGERCDQAKHLTRSLESSGPGEADSQWSLRDGDAHRIEESLKLSLDYFRQHQ